MPFAKNPGRCPDECVILDEQGNVAGYRRVHVVLFNGIESRAKSPNGWPSGGRDACNWRIRKPPFPFDIEFWEIV